MAQPVAKTQLTGSNVYFPQHINKPAPQKVTKKMQVSNIKPPGPGGAASAIEQQQQEQKRT